MGEKTRKIKLVFVKIIKSKRRREKNPRLQEVKKKMITKDIVTLAITCCYRRIGVSPATRPYFTLRGLPLQIKSR